MFGLNMREKVRGRIIDEDAKDLLEARKNYNYIQTVKDQLVKQKEELASNLRKDGVSESIHNAQLKQMDSLISQYTSEDKMKENCIKAATVEWRSNEETEKYITELDRTLNTAARMGSSVARRNISLASDVGKDLLEFSEMQNLIVEKSTNLAKTFGTDHLFQGDGFAAVVRSLIPSPNEYVAHRLKSYEAQKKVLELNIDMRVEAGKLSYDDAQATNLKEMINLSGNVHKGTTEIQIAKIYK